jgi:hypothetical protein
VGTESTHYPGFLRSILPAIIPRTIGKGTAQDRAAVCCRGLCAIDGVPPRFWLLRLEARFGRRSFDGRSDVLAHEHHLHLTLSRAGVHLDVGRLG